MILISTLRKMRNKPVFVVTIPAHTRQVGDLPPVDVAKLSDGFATKSQADKFASENDPRQWGAPEFPVVARVPAHEYAASCGLRLPSTAPGGELDAALAELIERAEAGEEFPDACGRAASRFSVCYDALRAAYDEREQA
jgi:hypothetical protein